MTGVHELRQRVRSIRAADLFCTDCAGCTSCVSNTPLTGGAFFAEPQREGVAALRGGGQEGRHLRFLPSCAPAGQASSVRFACGKSCGFSHEKFPFLFSQNVCTGIFARLNRVRISTGFLMLFGMKLIFSKVLKRLCFYVCNPYNARMKRVIFV